MQFEDACNKVKNIIAGALHLKQKALPVKTVQATLLSSYENVFSPFSVSENLGNIAAKEK